MNRILFLSLGLLCASPVVLTSCGDSDNGVEEPKKGSLELLEGATDVHFEVGVNAASVKFSATAAWIAKTSDSWLSVNPPSGVGGFHTLSFTAQRNTKKEERKATVTIASGEQQIVINVTQDANTEEIIDETTIKDLDKYYKPQEFGSPGRCSRELDRSCIDAHFEMDISSAFKQFQRAFLRFLDAIVTISTTR